MQYTRDQIKQISECIDLRLYGATHKDCIELGFARACVDIAFGRDLENLDPYGPNNGAV